MMTQLIVLLCLLKIQKLVFVFIFDELIEFNVINKNSIIERKMMEF